MPDLRGQLSAVHMRGAALATNVPAHTNGPKKSRQSVPEDRTEGCVLVTTWYQIIVSVLPNCFSL